MTPNFYLPQGVHSVRRRVPEILEDAENGLSDGLRRLLVRGYEQLCQLDGHIAFYADEVKRQSQAEARVKQLQTIPGFGPILASVFHSVVGDGQAYRCGRDVAAALRLVFRQHSSGGKSLLLGISKHGDGYLRSLLVHGARSVVSHTAGKDDRLSRWIERIKRERGINKSVVALANKLARIACGRYCATKPPIGPRKPPSGRYQTMILETTPKHRRALRWEALKRVDNGC